MTFEPTLNDADDPEQVVEQRALADHIAGAGAWEDLCIRRLDPCDPAFWDEDFEDLDL